MVDQLAARRIAKRRGAAAEFFAGFVQFDPAAVFGQSRRRGQARQTAPHDHDGGRFDWALRSPALRSPAL
jgi:hypothetical protein